MKENLKLMICFALAATLSSCKKDSTPIDSSIAEYNQNLKKITNVVGRMHNEAVQVALNTKTLNLKAIKLQSLFPQTPDPSTPSPIFYTGSDITQAINSIYNYVEAQPEFVGIPDRGIPTQLVSPIISMVYAPTAGVIDSKIDSTVTVLRSNNIITQREAGMVKEIQDIFVDGYALNMTQAFAGPYFAGKLTDLKNKYANIIWEINEGELYLGTLEIAISSNQYWHANSQQLTPTASVAPSNRLMSINKTSNLAVPPFTPGDPETPIVQVDLAAYALAWGWQVFNEGWAGTLHSSGQYRRIKIALQVAMTTSTLRLVKTASVLITPELFVDLGSTPVVVPNTPGLAFPEPLTTELVYYTNNYVYIGSNYAPPFLTTRIYKQGSQYFYDSNFYHLLPTGYYILQSDLLEGKYYQVNNGVIAAIAVASNDANAPVPTYVPYNPFLGTLGGN